MARLGVKRAQQSSRQRNVLRSPAQRWTKRRHRTLGMSWGKAWNSIPAWPDRVVEVEKAECRCTGS